MMNIDQVASDNKFYTKQLQDRSALILNLDPENTNWFEIVGEMEKTIKGLKSEVLELIGKVSDVSQQAYEAGLMDGANQ